MRILQEHRIELNRLAEALLEHETLSKDEIISVCRGEKLSNKSENPPESFNEPEIIEHEKEEKIVNGRIIKTRGFTIFFNKP